MLNVNTELITRAQKGDLEVVGLLYEHYRLKIFRYLYYRVGDRQTAEDLTSEVFLRMLRFLSGFHPPSSNFQAWLFQIARNLASDHFRKANAHQDVELEDHWMIAGENLDVTVDRSLTHSGLRRALTRLPEEQRDVIVMRFVAGMPITEVAAALSKSEDAVKGLQRRALIALRQILSDWEIHYA